MRIEYSPAGTSAIVKWLSSCLGFRGWTPSSVNRDRREPLIVQIHDSTRCPKIRDGVNAEAHTEEVTKSAGRSPHRLWTRREKDSTSLALLPMWGCYCFA